MSTPRGRASGSSGAPRRGRGKPAGQSSGGGRPRDPSAKPSGKSFGNKTFGNKSVGNKATGRPARPQRGTDSRRGGPPTSGRSQRAPRAETDAADRSRRDEPPIPDGLDLSMLDRGVRAELRTLSKPNAEVVAGHLIAAGLAVDTDPLLALEHARAARGRASRLAVVREAVGVAAYHAEQWSEALTELRTARRISGDPRNLPLIADCERALGRPAQALRVLSDPDVGRLDPETRAELFIVVSGARRDLGQLDAALAVLARGGLDRERPRPGSVRLWYAYADILAELGRTEDAASWFAASAALDVDGDTDAAERAADLL